MSPNTRPDYRATQRGRQCQRRSKVLHNSRRSPPRSVLESYLALSRRGTLRPISDFLRLLNRLQRSCGFELFDVDENDDFVRILADNIVDAHEARDGLKALQAVTTESSGGN